MSNSKPEEQKIDIVFESAPDYKIVSANGIWGGLTPKGDLKVDFFVESQAFPPPGTHTYHTTAEGRAQERSETEKARQVVRRIQVGVIISPHHVESFAKWFAEKAQQIKITMEAATKKVH